MDPIGWFISHYAWDKVKELFKEWKLFGTDLHEKLIEQAFDRVRKENDMLHIPIDIIGDAFGRDKLRILDNTVEEIVHALNSKGYETADLKTYDVILKKLREAYLKIRIENIKDENTKKQIFALIEEQRKGYKEKEIEKVPIDSFEEFEHNLKDWLKCLKHEIDSYDYREKGVFEFISRAPKRRGFESILIRGVEGAINSDQVKILSERKKNFNTEEAWIVSIRRVDPLARDEAKKHRNVFVYNFDDLIDETANFNKYFEWLENECKIKEIDKYYVDLSCTKPEFDISGKESGINRYKTIDEYIEVWLSDPAKEHISLLGEFGTGKTWFCLHYAFEMLNEYKKAKDKGIERPRLPIVIPLRDYAKAVSVESLFSEFFFRKHEIGLPGYSAFEQLNKMGKFLLIFDGFDEMAQKTDYQQTVNNFWELAKIVVPGSKAILTCRTEHFRYAQEGRDILGAKIKASTKNIILEPPKFEIAHIEKLTNEQIGEIIIKRKGEKEGNEIADKIFANEHLADMAGRPVLIEFILDALPDIKEKKYVDMSQVFLYACTKKMQKDIKEERTFTSMADKVYFMCELAYEMISKDQLKINYKMFPESIRRYFDKTVEEVELDHWEFDLMRQTLLIKDNDGNYSFAHKSLAEFFVAYKFASELGILKQEFLKIAKERKECKEKPAEKMKWSDYFHILVEKCPPLANFETESIENLRNTFGKMPVSPAVRKLLAGMVENYEKLYDLIKPTRNKKFEYVGYAASNIATLLNDCKENFSEKGFDFSNLILNNADFSKAKLIGLNFENSDLINSNFHSAYLTQTNFRNAILKNANLNNTVLENTNFSYADLEGATFGEMGAVYSLFVTSDKKHIVSGSVDGTIKIWDFEKGEEIRTLKGHNNYVRSVFVTADKKHIVSGSRDGTIKIWDFEKGECIRTLKGHNNFVSSVFVTADKKHIVSGSWDGTIKIWDFEKGECIRTLKGHNNFVSSVFVTADKKHIVSGSWDGTIKIWDFEKGECIRTLKGHNNFVSSVFVTADKKHIVSGSDDRTIKIWDFEKGECIRTLKGHNGYVSSVFVTADKKHIVSGSDDRTIKIWDFEKGECIRTLKGHNGYVWSVFVTADKKHIVSGSDDGTIKIWDFEKGEEIRTLEQKMECKGMNIKHAKGLSKEQIKFLKERGAIEI